MPAHPFLSTVLALCATAAGAAELPCTFLENDLLKPGPEGVVVPAAFLQCVRVSRVCVLNFPDGQVLRAETVRELPTDGASAMAVLQSPPGELPALCLIGFYGGGSAATWGFDGWSITHGRGVRILGMDKTRMNNDVVAPRTLGNAIYGAYARAKR